MNRGDKFVLKVVAVLLGMIIGMVIYIIFSGTKYTGEDYYEQDKDNPTLYYVYMHETDNPQNKYKIETQSQIIAKQLSEIKGEKLHFKNRYVVFENNSLPYEKIEDNES